MFFHDAAAKIDHQTNHALDSAAHHVGEEKVVSEPLLAHGACLGIVKDDRSVSSFKLVEDRVKVWVPPFFAWNRRGFYVECLAPHFLGAAKFFDRLIGILQRNDPRPHEAAGLL